MRISDWSSDVCSSDLHDIGCASEEEAAVANVPDSPRGTPAAESGGQYEKRTHRLTRGGGGFHSRSAGFGESIRKGSRGRSAARRGGKECVSTCRSRWSRYH